MRDKGLRPCPRCLVLKEKLDKMGQKRDISFRLLNPRRFLVDIVEKARSFIYEKAYGIGSKLVNDMLKPSSSVPTMVRQLRPR